MYRLKPIKMIDEDLLPRSFFEDQIAKGIAYGAIQKIMKNRFTLLKLPVGYGKTVISMLVIKALAKLNQNHYQIMVLAPKAKRLDKSFDKAIRSVETYYNIYFKHIPINGEKIGTFSGLNKMISNKPDMFLTFMNELKGKNTLLILDETHMQLRDATSKANRNFRKIFKEIEKSGGTLKILGLTATPFDKSILDTVGYLIINGAYSSRTDFYKKEIKGYDSSYSRGISQVDIDNMIVDSQYRIHKEMFYDIKGVIEKLKQFIYAPEAPRTFHVPQNIFEIVPVELTVEKQKRIDRIKKMEKQKAYPDYASKVTDYTKAITEDKNILDYVISLVKDPDNKQAIIFYQRNDTLYSLKKVFEENNLKYLEVNGHNQSYFKVNDTESTIFVQYLSGAVAFESKTSNLSIYIDLPASSINFEQSLGRNARRGQNIDIVKNYILTPMLANKVEIDYYKDIYNRIVNKTHWNKEFEKNFLTPWGKFNENA